MTLGLWKPPLWVTPLPEEPPHGMYLRLAERNGLRHIRVFENMIGVKLRHVRLGRDLDYLAAILRCEPHQLSEYSIQQGRRGSLIIRGEAVRRKDVMMVERRACPACFAISAHHRFWWDLRFVTTCPMHAIRLANRCSCGGKLTWTDGSLTKCHTCEHGDVRLLSGEPAPYDVGSLDRWILSRFGIVDYKEKVPIIHKQPLGTAIEIVERIGALVVGGYRTHWQQITDYSQPPGEVRAIGFRTLEEGKLAGALDRAYDGFLVSTHKAAGISTMYGWFSYWFCHRGGPRLSTELADIMLKHAQGKAQVSRLAFPSLSRSNDSITLNEASRMCRVRPGTLRKLLAAENLIRPEKRKGSPVMIPFKIAKRMANDLAASVNLRGVAEIVGVRGVALVKLSRSGSIPAWVRGGNVTKPTYIFRRAEVVAWLNKLIGRAPPVTVVPDGMIPVVEAAEAASIAITVLVNAIATGHVRVERVLKGKRNLRGALVLLDAVKAYRKLVGPQAAGDPLKHYTKRRATRVSSKLPPKIEHSSH
jgi:TniQ